MTKNEHYSEAERLLAEASEISPNQRLNEALHLRVDALTHAILSTSLAAPAA